LAVGETAQKRNKKSFIWDKLGQSLEGQPVEEILKISRIVEAFLRKGNVMAVKHVLEWPEACLEKNLVLLLLKNGQQDLAKVILKHKGVVITPSDFRIAFDAGQYELCVDMLQFRSARIALTGPDIQEALLELLTSGETCLQSIEILNVIPLRSWNMNLTKDAIQKLMNLIKKTNEIIVCPEPLLFCVLAVEFLNKISSVSLQFENRCKEAAAQFIDLADYIEESYKDEDELSYALSKSDSLGRSALVMISRNQLLRLLENDEIGTIVTKMWIGRRRSYGLDAACTLWRSFVSPSGSEEALQFMKSMDKNRPYSFHFEQWTESCSQRFSAQAFSSLVLVVFYQMLIYTAIGASAFDNVADDPTSAGYLRLSQVWVTGIFVEHFLSILFAWKTGRIVEIDSWRRLDLTMFCTMIVLMIGIHNYIAGSGNLISDIEPALANALLHSFMMLLIWIRFMAVLLTSKRFGPFLRMIYLMMKQLATFFIIYFCIELCGAAVFTSLFNNASVKYESFGVSIRSLFGAAIGDFDLEAFTDYIAVGGILLGVYLIIAFVLLFNLLIALLSNVYNQIILKVDAEHRIVLVSYFDRFRWDDRYGLLIFMPSPLSYLVMLCAPFLLRSKDPKPLNLGLCKVFYILYAIPQFLMFFVLSATSLPLLLVKGFVIFGKLGKIKKVKKARQVIHVEGAELDEAAEDDGKTIRTGFSVFKCISWLFVGPFVLLWALIRDCFEFWAILYRSLDSFEKREYRLENFVTSKCLADVQLILSSIRTSDVSSSQLVEQLLMLESNDDQSKDEGYAASREALAADFFNQFAKAQNDPMIDVQLIRRLLPVRTGHFYDDEYLRRAQHIHIPWLSKAVKRYQQKVGSIVIGGVPIPKSLGVGNSLLGKESLEVLQRSARDLDSKLNEALSQTRSLAAMMETHASRLSKLTGAQVEREDRSSAW
jgi:hypothetical protein